MKKQCNNSNNEVCESKKENDKKIGYLISIYIYTFVDEDRIRKFTINFLQ